MLFLKSLLGNVWLYVALAVLISGLVGAIYYAGQRANEVKIIERTIKNVKVKNAVTEKLGRMPSDARRKRLLLWSTN